MISIKKYGANSEYRMLHLWVEKNLGKPLKCSICGTTSRKRYHWANISETYKKELSDWRRLCVSCHGREKHLGFCRNGHELTLENTYKPKSSNFEVECVTCRKIWHSRSNHRQKFIEANK